MPCYHKTCSEERTEEVRFIRGSEVQLIPTCSEHKPNLLSKSWEDISGITLMFSPLGRLTLVPPNQSVTPIQSSGSANVPTSESTGSEYQAATANIALTAFPSPFFYYVYSSNGFYFCKNTQTGIVESTSSDASVVLQYAINNTQGTIYVQKGLYLCGSQLVFSGHFIKIQGERTIFGLGGVGDKRFDTILKKNYNDPTFGFIKIDGSPTFMKVQFQDLVIQGDNAGIGVDCTSVNEMWDFMSNVMITSFLKGMTFTQVFEVAFHNLFVVNCTFGIYYNAGTSNTNFNTYFYGGSVEDCNYNVWISDASGGNIALDDAAFNSVVLEGALSGGNAVYVGAGSTRVKFHGCSFEDATNTTQIVDNGTINSYINNRFGSATLSGSATTAVQFNGGCYGSTFAHNGFDLLNNGQTWNITIISGAQNINIFGNRLGNNQLSGVLTLTNPTQSGHTRIFGNDNVQDQVGPLGMTSINDINGNILMDLNPNDVGNNTIDFFGNSVQGISFNGSSVKSSGRFTIQSASGYCLNTSTFVSGNTGNFVALNSSAFGPVGFFYIQASGGTTYKVPFMNS